MGGVMIGSVKTPFIILCQGHSGTTYLASLLDSHPDIACYGELFNDKSNRRNQLAFHASGHKDPRAFFRELVARTNARAVGFKLGAWGMRMYHPEAVDIVKEPGLHVIRLRRNPLAKLLSTRLSGARRSYRREPVRLPPQATVRSLRYLEFENMLLDGLTQGKATIQLTYEELVADPAIEQVQRFLGVEPRPLNSTTSKRRTRPLREMIVNWDEIATELQASGLRQYLDGEAP
jgi:hypothetical protein